MLPTKIYVRLVVAKMLFRLPKIRRLIKRDFSALHKLASLKIYKNKSQNLCTEYSYLHVPQPELSGLFCAAQNKKRNRGRRYKYELRFVTRSLIIFNVFGLHPQAYCNMVGVITDYF
jgi:hypothetical protein